MQRLQLGRLKDAMIDAYPDRTDLDLLMLGLGRSRAMLVGDGVGTKEVVLRMIQSAHSEGWLGDLVHAVIEDRPNNQLVRQFAVADGRVAAVASGLAVPTNVRRLDSAHFDLDAARDLIHERTLDHPPGLLGLRLTTRDDILVGKLCSWLQDCLGDVEPVRPMTLQPEYGEADTWVKQVLQHAPGPDDGGKLWSVRIDRASPESVRDFWDGVRGRCPRWSGGSSWSSPTCPAGPVPRVSSTWANPRSNRVTCRSGRGRCSRTSVGTPRCGSRGAATSNARRPSPVT
ncbi:effector-associated domain EAD1-containing protein [Dactylosporangium cerinum]